MPYYLIHDTVTNADDRLVKAKNAASALNHAVNTRMTIRAVSIDELADLLTSGEMPLEVASKDADSDDAKDLPKGLPSAEDMEMGGKGQPAVPQLA